MAQVRRIAAVGVALVLAAGGTLGQGAPDTPGPDAQAPASAAPAPALPAPAAPGPGLVPPVPPLPVVIVPSGSLDTEAPSAVASPAPVPAAADAPEPPDPVRAKMEQSAGLKVGPGVADPMAALPKVELPAPQAPFTLLHPEEVDSVTLSADGRMVALDGVIALPDPAGGLQAYVRAQGDQVTCDAQGAGYACALPDGTDVALVSLANGAARAAAEAPESYRQQEAAAQAARRGAWAGLPPPPSVVPHPAARTSALLASGADTYPLAGLQGFPGRPAQELQGYVAAHGDSVTCQQQPGQQQPGTLAYICSLPDGTDLGKVALVNGAARLAPGAPASYQAQQADAVANRRGIWATMAAPLPVVTTLPPPAVAPAPGPGVAVLPAPVPDGPPVAYLGDQPTAVIDGEQAFFVFGGAGLGWGYWDRGRHWHGAPDGYARALERSHPDGRIGGHGGYARGGPGEGVRPDGFGQSGVGRVGFVPGAGAGTGAGIGAGAVRGGFGPGGAHLAPAFARPGPGFARPEFARPEFARPEFARPAFGRPAFTPPGFNQGAFARAQQPFNRPGFAQPGFAQPSFARPSLPLGRPGPAAFAVRPAMPAAVPHIAAPVARPSAPAVGGFHHH